MTAHPRQAGSTGTRWQWLEPALHQAAVATGNWPPTRQPGGQRWTPHPRIATRTPGAAPGSVRAAREFTLATLQRWGATGRCDDILIVVSELLTNAQRHAAVANGLVRTASPVRLGLLQPGQYILCAVADPSSTLPVVTDTGLLGENGRGLRVIAELADAWGYTAPCRSSKIVWAVFDLGEPGRPPPPTRGCLVIAEDLVHSSTPNPPQS